MRASPTLWWRHVGNAILTEVRQTRPATSVRLSLRRRRQYMRLYKALHVQDLRPGTHKVAEVPKRTPSEAAQRLQALEAKMTVGEVAAYRTFVALQCSRYLHTNKDMRGQWVEVVDALGAFLDMIPQMAAASGDLPKGQASGPQVVVSIHCPCLGVRLLCGSPNATTRTRPTSGPDKQHAARPLSGGDPVTHLPDASSEPGAISSAEVPGTSSSEAGSRRGEFKDVCFLAEGLVLRMPSVSQLSMTVQGLTLHATSQDGASQPHLLKAPVSNSHVARHCSRMDLRSLGGNADRWSQEGESQDSKLFTGIYPKAYISLFLSHVRVELRPLELVFEPAVALAVVEFWQQCQPPPTSPPASPHSIINMTEGIAIRDMVLNSYIKRCQPVPASVSSMAPIITLACSQLLVRMPLQRQHAGSLPGVAPALCSPSSSHELVLCAANCRVTLRYVKTCYNTLLQQLSLNTNVEMYFHHTQPHATVPTATPGNQPPPFALTWLHPADAEAVFDWHTTQQQQQSQGLVDYGSASQSSDFYRRLSRGSSTATSGGQGGGPGGHGKTVDANRAAAAHSPFSPVLKISNFQARLSSQVSQEPAVPGQQSAAMGVAASGALAWFSPWHLALINAVMDQVRHPCWFARQCLGRVRVGLYSFYHVRFFMGS